MYYPKRLATPKVKKTILRFADFLGGMRRDIDPNILPLKYAYNAYNFDISDGALKDGLGIEILDKTYLKKQFDLVYPHGQVLRAWQYYRYDFDLQRRDDKLIIYMSDGYLYYVGLFDESVNFEKINDSYFSSPPNFLNYRLNSQDVLIATSPEDEMLVFDGAEAYRVVDAPKITSMSIHYERLFATSAGESNQIWFSKELDPINWDINLESAGFIEMNDQRGALLEVMSFLDYVYVFREFGITRISAYADQAQFFVSHLFTSSGRICKNTVALCGDRVIFLTSSGLYAFDGLQTHKILDSLTDAIRDLESARAVFYNGKYYLACKFDFGDSQKVHCENSDFVLNAIIEYDIIKKSYAVYRGIDTADFCPLKIGSDELLTLTVRGENSQSLSVICQGGKYYQENLKKVWQSPYTDLGLPNQKKVLKALYITSHSPCMILINADGQEFKYNIGGNQGVTRITPKLAFGKISIAFVCERSPSYITRPILELDISR
ncbi:MAG TPA: hypothetical protein GX745_00665 [Clostridiales bacterium]|nr:hypothetical protein [Clostridiales bacterium]